MKAIVIWAVMKNKMQKIQDVYITLQAVKYAKHSVHSQPLDVPGADTSLTTSPGRAAISNI